MWTSSDLGRHRTLEATPALIVGSLWPVLVANLFCDELACGRQSFVRVRSVMNVPHGLIVLCFRTKNDFQMLHAHWDYIFANVTVVRLTFTPVLQTAIARRASTEGPSRKVFIKCHINLDALCFDSVRARLEVDLLNKLSRDVILSPHLPRLERTTWLDSHAQNSRSMPMGECRSGEHGKISVGGQAVTSHILLLEFERSSGNLLSQQVDEVRSHVTAICCT